MSFQSLHMRTGPYEEKCSVNSCRWIIRRLRWSALTGLERLTSLGDRPMPIVVKLLRFKEKMAVLERDKIFRGTNIFLNLDFSEAVHQRRKELIPAMKAAREHGNIAYIDYDRLIDHPPSQKPGRNESQTFLFIFSPYYI